ncbi:IBR domain containing protein-like protein [Dinothrombium tinctorium]|uniref:IBR domain containing protein-like protein n=1 Tax=Dinothrombium tinctorium TaxID=1965070 RepID=A0A443RH52_9ACAR|nr:IBR domain containing protein-like protein [Dinothrombium tinctorium]
MNSATKAMPANYDSFQFRKDTRTSRPTACNLCGSVGAIVECEKCQSMAFCSSCDDMYHRHPKRRFHLRKSLLCEKNLTQTKSAFDIRSIAGKIFSSNKSSNETKPMLNQGFAAHPSNMPIPPPRRKKRDATLTRGSTPLLMQKFNANSNFRRFQMENGQNNNSSTQQSTPQMNKSFAEQQRMFMKPSNLNQMPAQTPTEEFRRSSYQSSLTGSDVSSEPWTQDMQFEPIPPPLPQKTRWNQTLTRRNLSVNDLCDQYPEPIFPPFYGYPSIPPHNQFVNPWMNPSLSQSMEDFQDDDDQNSVSEYNVRGTLARGNSRNRSQATMRRSQSFMQMSPIPWGMQQFPPYYYYPPYYPPPPPPPQQMFRPHPSPPASVRSMSLRRRESEDNLSIASLNIRDSASIRSESVAKVRSKSQAKVEKSLLEKQIMRPASVSNGHQRRSSVSSPRCLSDSDLSDEESEEFASFSESTHSSCQIKDHWKCRHCTYMNSIEKHICEVCAKSRNLKKRTNQTELSETSAAKAALKQQKCTSDIVITQEMIDEQKEVEKEIRRRLENEQRIAKENKKIERREERMRRKTLSSIADKVQAFEANSAKQVDLQRPASAAAMAEGIASSKPSFSSSHRNQSKSSVKKEVEKKSEANVQQTETSTFPPQTNPAISQASNMMNPLQLNPMSPQQFPYPMQHQAYPSYADARRASVPFSSMNATYSFSNQNVDLPMTSQFSPSSPYFNSLSRLDHIAAGGMSTFEQIGSPRETFGFKQPVDHRYLSTEDLHFSAAIGSQHHSNMKSGFEMIKLLREAEKKGFTADDVEIALNFSPGNALEWLEENWSNMIETVLTLANNQLMHNEKKKGNTKKGLMHISLISEAEAKDALRAAKGNIWQAIEKCVQRKQEGTHLDGKGTKSFTLKLEKIEELVESWKKDIKEGKKSKEGFLDTIEELVKQKIEFIDATLNARRKNPALEEDIRRRFIKEYFSDEELDEEMFVHENAINYSDEKANVARDADANEDGEGEESKISKRLSDKTFFVGNESVPQQSSAAKSEANVSATAGEKGKQSSRENARIIEALSEINATLKKSLEQLDANQIVESNGNQSIINENDVTKVVVEENCRSNDEEKKEAQNFNANDALKIDEALALSERSESRALKDEQSVKPKVKEGKKGVKKVKTKKQNDKEAKNAENAVKAESSTNAGVTAKMEAKTAPNFGTRATYECELCAGTFKLVEMVSLPSCTHSACIECLQQYFTVQIREKQKVIIPCPFCNQPEINHDDEDAVSNYLIILDQLLKALLPDDIHELFERKVRDRALQKDPSFRWCSQCSSGFLAGDSCAQTIMCPDCKAITCSKCNRLWEKQHSGISCEKFAEWKKANDPKFAESQLDLHLKQFGIDCPNCKFHYELSKGGCIHFHCLQCGHDFCGGCQMPFKMGDKCNQSQWCNKLGFHAHHPRNCLFYLRDREVAELKKLLDINGVKYETQTSYTAKNAKGCPVMEQKETEKGMIDASCNKEILTDGLCKNHYIEYLSELIRKNKVDPIAILTEDEMVHLLRRANIKLPIKTNAEVHLNNLRQIIQEELPLCQPD